MGIVIWWFFDQLCDLCTSTVYEVIPMKQQAMTKTCSFAAVHMAVAFAVGWALTGDIWVGSALALVEPACNTLAFYFHEKWWSRREGRKPEARENQHLPA